MNFFIVEEYLDFLYSYLPLLSEEYGANQPMSIPKIKNTIDNHWYAAIYYTGPKVGFRLIEPYVLGKGYVHPKTGIVSHPDRYYLRAYVILDTQKQPEELKKQFSKERGMRRKSVSKSGKRLGWRLMRVDSIQSWQPIQKKVKIDRPFYNPNDKMINNIEIKF